MATPPRLTWHDTIPDQADRWWRVHLNLAAGRGDGSGPDDYSDGLSLLVDLTTRGVWPVDAWARDGFARAHGAAALAALQAAVADWIDTPTPTLRTLPDAGGYWFDGTASWPGDPNRVPYVDPPPADAHRAG
jgi:hypothetical protein